MVLEGKREDDFPGLNQERVDGGERGRGGAGRGRAGWCLLVFALLVEALETRSVCPKAVCGPFLAGRPGNKAHREFFLCLWWGKREGGSCMFPKHI